MSEPCPKCSLVHEKCKAHTRSGKPCRGTPMHGQKVCRMHGGSSPHCINAARVRLAALVDPAIGVLALALGVDPVTGRKLPGANKITPLKVATAQDVLDRNGLKTAEEVKMGGLDGGPLEVVFIKPGQAQP